MLAQHSFVTLELNPETGLMEPVMPGQLWEETVGFTQPPNGLPAMFREEWQELRKRNMAQAWRSIWRGCARPKPLKSGRPNFGTKPVNGSSASN